MMDTNTEALERIAESWDGCTYDAVGGSIDIGECLREQFAALSQPPAVQVPGWISVEDRLPDVGQEVIVFRPLAAETNDPIIDIRKFLGFPRISPQGVEHRFDCWCHPTHWMPRPPSPAAKKEGGAV